MANALKKLVQQQPLKRVSEPQRHLGPVAPVREAQAQQAKPATLMLVVMAIVAVLGIFATQLWLSVATSAGAYEANDLILEERELIRTERVMEQEVLLYGSPQNLSQQAVGQGMVQNAQPAFLALAGASIEGELTQRSSEARANTIANAALADFTTPEADARKAERAAAESAKAEAAAAAAAEKESEDAAAASAAVKPQKPAEPVAWSGALPAPATH